MEAISWLGIYLTNGHCLVQVTRVTANGLVAEDVRADTEDEPRELEIPFDEMANEEGKWRRVFPERA